MNQQDIYELFSPGISQFSSLKRFKSINMIFDFLE